MATVLSLVEYASQLLNDQEVGYEYTTWEQPMLLQAYNEGVAVLCARLPHLFQTQGSITLGPGGEQTVPDDLQDELNIIGTECNRFGVPYVDTSATNTTADELNMYGDAQCNSCDKQVSLLKGSKHFAGDKGSDASDPCGKWKLSRYAWNPANPASLLIQPAIPAGMTPTIKVSYLKKPVPQVLGDTTSVPTKAHHTIIDWILYRAFSTEEESKDSIAKAQQHKQNFDADTEDIYTRKARAESKWYMGRRGDKLKGDDDRRKLRD